MVKLTQNVLYGKSVQNQERFVRSFVCFDVGEFGHRAAGPRMVDLHAYPTEHGSFFGIRGQELQARIRQIAPPRALEKPARASARPLRQASPRQQEPEREEVVMGQKLIDKICSFLRPGGYAKMELRNDRWVGRLQVLTLLLRFVQSMLDRF